MPAWLSQPHTSETAGQRWGRRVVFVGVALLTVALAGGATMLGLSLYETHGSMEVVAGSSQAELAARAAKPGPQGQPDGLPYVERRSPSLPPLVLLPPDPTQKKDAATAAVAPGTPNVAKQADTVVPAPAPAAPAKVTAPAPVVATKVEKPVAPFAAIKKPAPVVAAAKRPAIAAQPPKPAPAAIASKSAAKPVAKAKLASAKKPNPVKRTAATTLARAKPVEGRMLPPPRERDAEPVAQDPPRRAVDRRCLPGELARECAARTQ